MRRIVWCCTFLLAGCRPAPELDANASAGSEEFYAPYTNLRVLPKDASWPVLEEAMLTNLRGLGLRRTAGEGCLFCHVGSSETPMETWDFASDAKASKRTARVMMEMVQSINGTYLGQLEQRDAGSPAVTCYTCHEGRINPSTLLAVLDRRFASGGMDEVEAAYATLRDQYYGRGVYDFRSALLEFGVTLADRGAYDDAIDALRLNVEYAPDSPAAHRWLVRIVMERAARSGDGDALRRTYDSLAAVDRPDGALVWYTLRAVGVRLRNDGHLEAAAGAFSLNEQLYPDDPRVITDLAVTRLMLSDTAGAVAGARRALALQPGYDNALELLREAGTQP